MGETTSRGSYARERVRMTAATLTRAAAMIRTKAIEGRGAGILDTVTPGLTLRITGAGGTGYLRHRKVTIRLGSLDVLDLPAAREAAARVRRDVELGGDPRLDVSNFERQIAEGALMKTAIDVAFPPSAPFRSAADRRRRRPRQWQDLRTEFLAAKLPVLRESCRSQYAACHQGDEFEPIPARELQHLDILNLESLRDHGTESRAIATAARVVA